VVGWSTRPRPGYALIDQAHAVLWTAARRMVDLGRGQATAINASGQIIGTTREGGRFPGFVWQSGRRSLLPFSPYAISDRGQIVGMIDTGKKGPGCFPFDTCHAAVVWQKGHITRLPGLGGSANAEDINNNGQIVDWANTKTGQEHAVLWTKTG
jgi:probable HAF family extracellular repeat protein